MKRPPLHCFELEEWFRRYAFCPGMVNLSPSNPISPTIGEVLALAGATLGGLAELSLDYSQTAGAFSTRAAVAKLYQDLDPEHVVVTAGATEAILLGLEATVNPGARVVVESPLYGIYEPLLQLLGAEVTRYELRRSDAYEYDLERLEELVRTTRAELVVINPYNNPTGRGLATEAAITELVELAARRHCQIWSDDVFRLVSLQGPGLASPLDLTHDGVSVGDMTKAWGLGGLRIGWLACRDDAVIERVLNTRDYTTNSNSIVSERIAEHALTAGAALLDGALSVARESAETVDRFVGGSHGLLSWVPPAGGYCGWVEVHVDDATALPDLCASLADARRYLLLPGIVFGPQWSGFVRIGLAAGGEQLVGGLTALLEEAGLG